MTIDAMLQRLVLSSPQLESMANFYRHAFDYDVTVETDERRCEGNLRSVWIRRGAPNQLLESHFVVPDFLGSGGLQR